MFQKTWLDTNWENFHATTKFVRHGGKMQREIEAGAEQKEAAKVEAASCKTGS